MSESESLICSLLDALPLGILLLDPCGSVRSTSAQWEREGEAQTFLGGRISVGGNYLEACEQAPTSKGSEVAEGISAVLAGRLPAFTIDYSVTLPERPKRWHRLSVKPYQPAPGTQGAVVVHFDLTQLREAEQAVSFLANLSSLCTDLLCTLGKDGYFRRFNDAVLETLGYRGEELKNRPFLEFVHPDDRSLAEDAVRVVFSGGRLDSLELRCLRKDGAIRLLQWNGRLLPRESVICAVARDITETDVALEALRNREAHLALAQRVSRLGSWEVDLCGKEFTQRTLHWSEETHKIFGFVPGAVEVTPAFFIECVHPEDRGSVQKAFRTALETSTRYSIEHRIIRGDGEERLVREEAEIFRSPRPGSPIKVVGTVQDVTEKALAEKTLREQAALLNAAQDAIMVTRLDGAVLYWNRSAERIYGWTREESLGRKVDDFLCTDLEELHQARQQVLAQGVWSGEAQELTKEGKELDVEVRWTLLRDDAGRPSSILSINTDVTEKKKLEAQLFRAQRIESIGTLAGGIAHDLNNVLAPILMSLAILRDNANDPSDQELLDTMETSARRGADMVKQILTFARGIEGQRIALSPRHLIHEIESIVHETFLKQISVSTRYSDDCWSVVGDPTQLHQVLLNLCVNARDAMPNGGTIRIEAYNLVVDESYLELCGAVRAGAHVVFSVTDTGTGIPEEIREKIFDPFFTTKEVGRGTGLGLATVIAIVRSHGGFISVYSEVGAGTTFKVHLPAAITEERIADPETGLPVPSGAGELILVVDDEESVRRVTQRTLERYGYRTLIAEDGPEAIALFAQRRTEISLILTDMMMPLMDGVATIQALLYIEPEARIIAASGLAREGQFEAALAAGARAFLAKPYTAAAMLQAVAEALAKTE